MDDDVATPFKRRGASRKFKHWNFTPQDVLDNEEGMWGFVCFCLETPVRSGFLMTLYIYLFQGHQGHIVMYVFEATNKAIQSNRVKAQLYI